MEYLYQAMDYVLPYAKLVQVTTNPGNVLLALWVVWEWRYSIQNFFKNHQESARWFALGVFSGFFFGVLDHSYWTKTWNLDYAGDPSAAWWFEHGPLANVVFRIPGTSFAAYCHIRSARAYNDGSVADLNRKVFMIYLVTIAYQYFTVV